MGSLIAYYKELKGLGKLDCVGQEAFNLAGLPKSFTLLISYELIEGPNHIDPSWSTQELVNLPFNSIIFEVI